MYDYNSWCLHQHESEEEKWLASCPICAMCGEPIQGDYCWDFGDGKICEDCMEEYVLDCREPVERN